MRLGVLVSHLRVEEKAIFESARRKGIDITPVFDRKIVIDLSNLDRNANQSFPYDVVLDRRVAHSRALYTLKALESWGIPTLNHTSAVQVCDDKALCSLALGAAGVPTPRTLLAFSIESALEACEMLGYPAVLKPVTGSWGRLLAKVNGPQQAKALLEQKVTLGSYQHALFYVQEYQEKPGRDIRVFVVGDRVLAASYRSADHWITNTARGASSSKCPITPQIEDIVLNACVSVGARLAGVDLIETYDGYTVLEVNTGGEFHGLMTTTDVDIAGEIVEETVHIARASAMRRLETRATAGD
ncbi:MAG: lysine biosynthesis protein LysX [Thermomicrobiales bacterium]|nr:MAG: lysine biosynthesis protein LysX [Thermomicrobiales bacterium]